MPEHHDDDLGFDGMPCRRFWSKPAGFEINGQAPTMFFFVFGVVQFSVFLFVVSLEALAQHMSLKGKREWQKLVIVPSFKRILQANLLLYAAHSTISATVRFGGNERGQRESAVTIGLQNSIWAMINGAEAGVEGGTLVFLLHPSAGRTAVHNSIKFAIVWGALFMVAFWVSFETGNRAVDITFLVDYTLKAVVTGLVLASPFIKGFAVPFRKGPRFLTAFLFCTSFIEAFGWLLINFKKDEGYCLWISGSYMYSAFGFALFISLVLDSQWWRHTANTNVFADTIHRSLIRYSHRSSDRELPLIEAETANSDVPVIDFSLLRIGKIVAAGKSASVHKGRLYGRSVAVKRFYVGQLTADVVSQFISEASVSRSLANQPKHFVPMMGVCVRPPDLCVVMEWCPQGDLQRALVTLEAEGSSSRLYNPRQRMDWIKSLCEAVVALHNRGLMHRDIKPSNIMVNGDTLRLADLGDTFSVINSPKFISDNADQGNSAAMKLLGNSADSGSHTNSTTSSDLDGNWTRGRTMNQSNSFFGTPEWSPPEWQVSQSGNSVSKCEQRQSTEGTSDSLIKGDVWSLAIVLLQIASGSSSPFPGRTRSQVRKHVINGGHPEPCGLSNDTWSLLTRCWRRQADLRPSASEILQEVERIGENMIVCNAGNST